MERFLDSTGAQLRDTSSERLMTSSRAWLEVGDVMTRNVTTISSDETVVSVARMMAENRISCIVVVDEGNVVGILTETDFLKRVAGKDEAFGERQVVEIMSSPVRVRPLTSLSPTPPRSWRRSISNDCHSWRMSD